MKLNIGYFADGQWSFKIFIKVGYRFDAK